MEAPACGPAAAPIGLEVALPHENAGEPRLEPIGVAQGREVAPGVDEGRLDGVLGTVKIAQDAVRDREESVAGDGHQAGVRILVALDRPFDERSIHVGAPSRVPNGTLHLLWETPQSIGSIALISSSR